MHNIVMNQVSTIRQRLADIDQSAIDLRDWQRQILATYRQRERLKIELEKNLHRVPQHYARIVELTTPPTSVLPH